MKFFFQLRFSRVLRTAPGALALLLAQAYANALAQPAAAPALTPAYRAPFTPAADGELLQQVPAGKDPQVHVLKDLREKLNEQPADLPAADLLAKAYIDFGRQLGDAHYAGYAEAVLAPWLSRSSPPATALIDYATILQYRHQFAEARQQLRRALVEQPRNAQAWLTLATLDMVQGQYPNAAQDCSQVAASGGFQLGVACTGNLRSYTGQARQSLVLLNQLGSDRPGVSRAYQAWIRGLMAETCERLGDFAQAEVLYKKALDATPGDNFLLVAYADLLLDQKRPAEVLTLLNGSSQSDTAFLRLALAKAALHAADAASYTWIMAARFEALAQRGSDYFGREQVRYALFLQHEPVTALDLAQRNWQVQRAPWDARVFLEAALAAKDPQAAAPVLEFLRQTQLEDPVIEALVRQLSAQPAAGGK